MDPSLALLRTLVAIDSVNPSLVPGARGEQDAADAVAEHMRRTRENNASGLKLYTDAFQKLGLEFVPSAGNFILEECNMSRSRCVGSSLIPVLIAACVLGGLVAPAAAAGPGAGAVRVRGARRVGPRRVQVAGSARAHAR